jgi:hypothetical protein
VRANVMLLVVVRMHGLLRMILEEAVYMEISTASG